MLKPKEFQAEMFKKESKKGEIKEHKVE